MITLHVIVTNKTTVKMITGRGRGFEIGHKLIRLYVNGLLLHWVIAFLIFFSF